MREVEWERNELMGGFAPAPVPTLPPGLPSLLEELTREVLKANPSNIYDFCAQHFEKLVKIKNAQEGKKAKRKMTLTQKIEFVQQKLRAKAEERHSAFVTNFSKFKNSPDEEMNIKDGDENAINTSRDAQDDNEQEQTENAQKEHPGNRETTQNNIENGNNQDQERENQEKVQEIKDVRGNQTEVNVMSIDQGNPLVVINNQVKPIQIHEHDKDESETIENQEYCGEIDDKIGENKTMENQEQHSEIDKKKNEAEIDQEHLIQTISSTDVVKGIQEHQLKNNSQLARKQDIAENQRDISDKQIEENREQDKKFELVSNQEQIKNNELINKLDGKHEDQIEVNLESKNKNIENKDQIKHNELNKNIENKGQEQFVKQDIPIKEANDKKEHLGLTSITPKQITETDAAVLNDKLETYNSVSVKEKVSNNSVQTLHNNIVSNTINTEEVQVLSNIAIDKTSILGHNPNEENNESCGAIDKSVNQHAKNSCVLNDIENKPDGVYSGNDQFDSGLMIKEETINENRNIFNGVEGTEDGLTYHNIKKISISSANNTILLSESIMSAEAQDESKNKKDSTTVIGVKETTINEPYAFEDGSTLGSPQNIDRDGVSNDTNERNEKKIKKDFHEKILKENNTHNPNVISTETKHYISINTAYSSVQMPIPEKVDSQMLQDNVEILILNSETDSESNHYDIGGIRKEITATPENSDNQLENAKPKDKFKNIIISEEGSDLVANNDISNNPERENGRELEYSKKLKVDKVNLHKSLDALDAEKSFVNSISMDLETAAITIQKVFRAFLFKSRASTSEENTNEGHSLEISSEASRCDVNSDSDVDLPKTGMDEHIVRNEDNAPVLVRMNTVLQTVNEEKSLSLSTDESLSSAATVIQAHVRGFLVRNRRNSSKPASSDTPAASGEILDVESPRVSSAKTVLNINIREQEHFSIGDSIDTSLDLPVDPGVYVANLHPLGYDKDARKRLIREDAIQSVSPPSNSSFNSPKEMSEEQPENKNTNEPLNKENGDDGEAEQNNVNHDGEGVTKEFNAKHEEPSTTDVTGISSDEMDVVTPFSNENSEASKVMSEESLGLLHSGEFHDVLLPTRVVRKDSTIVREFKSVLVYFIKWHSTS